MRKWKIEIVIPYEIDIDDDDPLTVAEAEAMGEVFAQDALRFSPIGPVSYFEVRATKEEEPRFPWRSGRLT